MVRFTLRLAVAEIHVQGQRKSEMHRMTQTELGTLDVKSTLYTLKAYPEAQILVRFTQRLAVAEIQHIQGQRKSEMHGMALN